MVRCRIVLFLMFVSSVAFSQTFPRFRLIQLQQSDTVGQMIMSDTANNAFWSSDLRVQDSVFYIFGQPYSIDSTRLSVAGDSVIYFNNGVQIGGDVLPTGLIDSTRLDNDTLKYYQNGVVIGFDLIVTTIDSTRLNDTKDTLLYYQNGTLIAYDLIDGDATNEIQSITQFNIINDSLYIALSEDGTYGVDVSPYLDNTDTSGFNRQFYINSDTLYIIDDLSTKFVDLIPYLNTDEQTLSIVNDTLYISNGNGVDLSAYLDDKDEQTLSLSNDTLYISNGNSVYLDYVDTSGYNRSFVLNNDTLLITDDNGTLSVVLDQFTNTDTSGYNRTLVISNDSLYLSDDNSTLSIDLSPYLDNTDTSGYNTAFEIINDTLYIQDGSSRRFVSLNPYLDNTDTSGYNIDFSINNDTITLTDGLGTKTIVLPYSNTDTSGYNKNFTLQDSVLYLQDGDTTIALNIIETYDNTDTSGYNQSLTLLGNTLYLTDGQSTLSVDISQFNDNTDTSGYNSNFYIDANKLYIVDGQSSYNVNLSPYLDNTDTSGILKAFYILNDSIYISDGNVNARADLSPYLDNTDTSGYNISLELINGFLILRDGTTTLQEDLNIFFDNTDTSGYNKQFYVSGNRIYLEDGAGQLFVQATDYDKQNLSLQSDTLYIERGNYVILPLGTINTDDQVISISNDTIFLEDGGFVILPNNNTDTSGFNRTFVLGDSILYLLDDNALLTVDLKSAFDNTDDQQLSKVDSIITLEDGGSVILLDDDPTNELQNLSVTHDTLYLAVNETGFIPYERYIIYLTNGDSVIIYDKYYDPDYDPTNELQQLGILNDTIYLTLDTNFIDLTPYLDDTDEQQISKSNDTIYLERGGFVKLNDDDPANELQILSSSVTVDSVINHLGLLTQAYKYTIRLTNGDSVIVYDTYNDSDISAANELQDLELNGNILRLTLSNVTIDLTPYLDDTDEQQLSKSGDTIFIERGGNVVLLDDDPTNELQDILVVNDTLYISNGNGVYLDYRDIDSTRLNNRGDTLIYYYNDSIVRKDPISTLIDVVDNCVPPLPNDVDIYAIFDMSGSVNTNDVVTVINVLNQWYSDYKTAYPDYKGKLYTIPVAGASITEEYLNYLPRLRSNTLSLNTVYDTINAIVTLPPWLEGGTFVAPDNILMLAFVNESEYSYHVNNNNFNSEPTATYISHLNAYKQEYQSMEYFTGVVYPLAATSGFLLHAMASAESKVLTDAEIQDYLGGNYSLGTYDSLTSSNPYDTLTPLNTIGWSHVLDKPIPASSSFTIQSFNTEINDVLAAGDKFYVSVIEDFSNNILTLRSIGSQTLDITVDSTGCISIEYLKGDIGVYGDSITILGDGSIQYPLFVDTTLIVTTKALLDSLANIPTFTDSTRLSDDAVRLEYFQNGLLIGFDTLTRGDGLFQEKWYGDGSATVLIITEQNGQLPNDPNDILLYRNGIYLGSDFIQGLTGNQLQLTFTPEVGDVIMATWFVNDVYTSVTAGIDSVFTDIYILGNGLPSNPLTIDTMYTASKAYVDSQIAATGTGTITGVNENDDPTINYGLDGGASVGKVNLKVDTTVIAAKQWVINQDYSLIDSVIGGYGLLGGGEQDNVILTTDTSVIVSKEYLSSLGYTSANETINIYGDVSEISGTTDFNLNVLRSTNVKGGNTGAILYQQSADNTTNLSLPANGTNVSEYILMDGLTAPYWESKLAVLVGSALKLDTARTINGVAFDGTQNITITSNTPQSLIAGDYLVGTNFNGSAQTTWSVDTANLRPWVNTISSNTNIELLTIDDDGGASSPAVYNGTTPINISYNTVGAPSVSGTNATGTWSIGITGNSGTATKLQTARTFQIAGAAVAANGAAVQFDGTAGVQLEVNELNASYLTTGTVPSARLSGTYNINISGTASSASSVEWANVLNKPTTFTPSAHAHPWTEITSTPTTLSGYGITDGVTNNTNQTISGVKTFNSSIIGNLSGTATNANNVDVQLVSNTADYYLTMADSSGYKPLKRTADVKYNDNTDVFTVKNYVFNSGESLTGKDNYVLTYDQLNNVIQLEPSSASSGSTLLNSITFNDSGSGSASGLVFDGSSAETISYNTVGAPSATGSGASGTWNISITGNSNYASVAGSANTAIKLQTPRTITLGGDLSGFANFDGSSNITISTTVLNNSHTHTASNITDLDLSGYVTLTGTQTITGLKTIQNRLLLDYLDENIVIGNGAGALINSTSDYNVLLGYNVYNKAQSNASYNVAIGYLAGQNDLGNKNVFIGAYTQGSESGGYSIQTNSVIIGYNSESGQYPATNEIIVGSNTLGLGSNTATVGNSAITKFKSGNYTFNVGQTPTDGYVLTYNSTAQSIQLEPAPISQTTWVEDANYVYYNGTKNVGIGTSTPTGEFSVEQEKNGLLSSIVYNSSNAPFARSSFTMQTGFNSIGITAFSDSSNSVISGIDAKSKIVISTNNDNGLVFLPYVASYFYKKSIFNDSLLYIDNTKIGVNTSTPLYVLDVNETGTNNITYSDGSVTGIANFAAAEDVLQIGGVLDDAYIFNNNIGGNIYFGVTESAVPLTAMTIKNDRNVGIGITNPTYDLHVNGDINFTGDLYDNGNLVSFGGTEEYVFTAQFKSKTDFYIPLPSNVYTCTIDRASFVADFSSCSSCTFVFSTGSISSNTYTSANTLWTYTPASASGLVNEENTLSQTINSSNNVLRVDFTGTVTIDWLHTSVIVSCN